MISVTIGYAFHNKQGLVESILDGLGRHVKVPVDYVFIFDGCTDSTFSCFSEKIKSLNGHHNISVRFTPDIFELNTNNVMIEMFTTDYLIVFQDDMILKDPCLIENLERANDTFKDSLGVVGFRDGFNDKYRGMWSSPFSGSGGKLLDNGQIKTVRMLNRGPIVFSKKVRDKIGGLSGVYNKSGSYSEIDYCLRAEVAGFTNAVIGASIDHVHKNNPKFINMDKENGEIFKHLWPGVL